ncbi:hypothetical protein WMY93_005716 [Mugilogobius chulae]|uniref:G-protein coupled receptors family 1 profile domain-containing protein n=1 Tax=Mugilogobius chulae TaxID=88201 RepID=A0AAW0PTV4_9GOBI
MINGEKAGHGRAMLDLSPNGTTKSGTGGHPICTWGPDFGATSWMCQRNCQFVHVKPKLLTVNPVVYPREATRGSAERNRDTDALDQTQSRRERLTGENMGFGGGLLLSGLNISSNTSFTFGNFLLFPFLNFTINDVLDQCSDETGLTVWIALKITILVTALLANGTLMCLLYRSRHNLSPSQLLALNISSMDVLYCLTLPFDLYVTLTRTRKPCTASENVSER